MLANGQTTVKADALRHVDRSAPASAAQSCRGVAIQGVWPAVHTYREQDVAAETGFAPGARQPSVSLVESVFCAGDFSGIFVRDPSPIPTTFRLRVETLLDS